MGVSYFNVPSENTKINLVTVEGDTVPFIGPCNLSRWYGDQTVHGLRVSVRFPINSGPQMGLVTTTGVFPDAEHTCSPRYLNPRYLGTLQ